MSGAYVLCKAIIIIIIIMNLIVHNEYKQLPPTILSVKQQL